jgi:mannose-6-phosphate isomerase-like protein (cupin superfamily)
MTLKHAIFILLSTLLISGMPALANADSMVVPTADLKWQDMGNGISAASISGDMGTGPSRFLLKYPVGLVTPNHHHDADHHVTLVSGTVTLTLEGKAHKLEPGAYFALSNKVPHIVKVEGQQDAVLFIQADGPWNVVMEQ